MIHRDIFPCTFWSNFLHRFVPVYLDHKDRHLVPRIWPKHRQYTGRVMLDMNLCNHYDQLNYSILLDIV